MTYSSRFAFVSAASLFALGAGFAFVAPACGGGGETTSSSSGSGGGTSSSSSGMGGMTSSSSSGGGNGGGGGMPTNNYDCSAPQGNVPMLKLTKVHDDTTFFDIPIFAAFAPGDDTRMFVVEQRGKIKIVKNGALLVDPFLDVSGKSVNPGGNDERGLLGMAFHPKYQQNGRFFIFYTDKNTQNQVIEEYARGTDGDHADPMKVQTLLDIDDPEGNHNGGMLGFSPIDGFLYIGLGDGGAGGDPHGPFGNGQNLNTLWGKIARLDVDSAQKPYAIPAGNMTMIPQGNMSTAVLPEIWDFGLRNPWRFSFDACTGDLYIGDVGQGSIEEIDVEPAQQGNKNYGWRAMEGTNCFDANLGCDLPAYTPPTVEYDHNIGCSINGGYVYRGKNIPSLRGTYFFSDFCSKTVWTYKWPGPGAPTQQAGQPVLVVPNAPSSFGQDNHGEIYVVERAVLQIDPNTMMPVGGGKIYRIDSQ